jgi:hypothetical protein
MSSNQEEVIKKIHTAIEDEDQAYVMNALAIVLSAHIAATGRTKESIDEGIRLAQNQIAKVTLQMWEMKS